MWVNNGKLIYTDHILYMVLTDRQTKAQMFNLTCMSCGPAGFDWCCSAGVVASGQNETSGGFQCIVMMAWAPFFSLLLILERDISIPLDWKIHQLSQVKFVCWFHCANVLCMTCMICMHQCYSIFYYNGDSPKAYGVPILLCFESLFLVHGVDGVWDFVHYIDKDTNFSKLLFLIMHRNKGMTCHVLCRKKRMPLYCIRCFTLVFFDDQKKEKLSHAACEQKRALWVADVYSPSLSLFLSVSVCISCLSSHILLTCFALLFFWKTISHIFNSIWFV